MTHELKYIYIDITTKKKKKKKTFDFVVLFYVNFYLTFLYGNLCVLVVTFLIIATTYVRVQSVHE